jgi:hypothetical protein
LKRGTAAMEEQQLFTTGWLQPQILWEHNARLLLREQFWCEAYVHMSSVRAGMHQFFFSIVLHITYMKSEFERTETSHKSSQTQKGVVNTVNHEPSPGTNDLE